MSEDGKLISGDNTRRIQKDNYLTFERKIGTVFSSGSRKCQSCGAPIDINAKGLCSYCGNTYNLNEKYWILTSIVTR